jgi:DNA polymerase III epsilon subunit-like protein
MMLFKADVEKSKYVIAHNLRFDKNVVFSAFKWHINMEPSTFWSSDKDFCTACHALSALKLPKFPRLDDMYTLVFQKPAPEGAHNALRDVEVLRDIFFATWGKTMLNASKGGTLRKKNKKQRKSQSEKY